MLTDLLHQAETVFLLAKESISNEKSKDQLVSLKSRFLGKSGEITSLMRFLRELPSEQKPQFGNIINQYKTQIEQLIQTRLEELNQPKIQVPQIDISLSGRRAFIGKPHPVYQVRDHLITLFEKLGFKIVYGPEIETEYHNFEALNIPDDHPSRDLQDTFYIELPSDKAVSRHLLRTHTSPVQIRTLLSAEPPMRIISPGRVYRCDSDVTHAPMFHQIEGLYVDQGVQFGDLKGVLRFFVDNFFGHEVKTRFRASFFPFTEPSAEMDIQCQMCFGKGCRSCKFTGWLEVLGCGMVDPEVFQQVGYHPDRYTGFAFGMGIDRLTMLKYRVDDLHTLFKNDIRFLRQF